jgi:hypothetical protein
MTGCQPLQHSYLGLGQALGCLLLLGRASQGLGGSALGARYLLDRPGLVQDLAGQCTPQT